MRVPVIVLVVLVAACSREGSDHAVVRIDRVKVNDRLLVAEFQIGAAPCQSDPKVVADESPTEVRLTALVTVQEGTCPGFAVNATGLVTLSEPLGTRRLVDASNGETIERKP